jgi:ABC-type multidrug transport system ATPase subunit
MEPLAVVSGWYGGGVDSEPDVPEAEIAPPAASAARNPDVPDEAADPAPKPATSRQTPAKTTARTPAAKTTPAKRTSTSANASGTAAKRTPAAKPAARTTGARTATAKSTAQKSTAQQKTASGGAQGAGAASEGAATSASATSPAAKPPTTAKAAPKTTPKAAPKAAPKTASTRAPAKPRTTSRTSSAPAGTDDVAATPTAAGSTRAKRPAGPARKTEAPLEVVARPVVVEAIAEVEVVEVLEVVESPRVEPARAEPAEPAEAETVEAETVEAETVEAEPADAEEAEPADAAAPREVVLKISGLVKRFDDTTAVAGIDLSIEAGSFFGLVGPNGAGKTTTLSMVTGLLRPDAGTVTVHGADVWSNPVVAKRTMGVLPDRLRLFDRLTGAQLLYYSGILHGLEKSVVRSRSADLAIAFGLEDSLDRLVTDYSAGMTKKVAIAAAMIHSPRLLVLDEPFESVDPVSAANVIEILQKYVSAGGTVVMSSHTMNLIERICDSVAVVVNGAVLATGTMAEVRAGKSLEERFVELAGGRKAAEGMEWLHKFSD